MDGNTGEIVHADRRLELANASAVLGTALYNKDLAPIPIARRTWTTYNYAALWISMAHCIPPYMLAAGVMNSGINWKQAVFMRPQASMYVGMQCAIEIHSAA